MIDLDDVMDLIAAASANDAVHALERIVGAVKSSSRSDEQRRALMEIVVERLNAACARRAGRTLQ